MRALSLSPDIFCFCTKPNILVIVVYHSYWVVSIFHVTAIDLVVKVVIHGQSVHDMKCVDICGYFNGLSHRVDALNSLLNAESLFTFNTRGRDGTSLNISCTGLFSAQH